MSRSRTWCFTVNNPERWRPEWDAAKMDYLIWAMERGESGTLHVQGYVRMKKRVMMNTMKGVLCQAAHLEVAKGTEEQNKKYVSKEPVDGVVHEHGIYEGTFGAKQGSRNELKSALEQLTKGEPREKVFREHLALIVKYPQGMEKAAELALGPAPTERNIHNMVIWGETGTGKSHRAYHSFPGAYRASVGIGTFDKYQGEDVVILDEFEPVQVQLQEFLTWTDKWPTQLKCRYANKIARWTKMIIISNTDPAHWWATASDKERQALARRLRKPMGMVVEVMSQEQEVDFSWMDAGSSVPQAQMQILGRADAVGGSTALPAPATPPPMASTGVPPRAATPVLSQKRGAPSRTGSPTGEPHAKLQRTASGDLAKVLSETLKIPVGSNGVIYISEDEEQESQSQ